jgi:hypothetical protein
MQAKKCSFVHWLTYEQLISIFGICPVTSGMIWNNLSIILKSLAYPKISFHWMEKNPIKFMKISFFDFYLREEKMNSGKEQTKI